MARRILQGVVVQLALCCCALAATPFNRWIDVPFVPQPRNGCGPASIAMVMQYWQRQPGVPAQTAAQMAQIARRLQPHHREVRASAMVRYFTQHGYRAFAFSGRWADLEHEIARGRPVIAAIQPGGGSSLHYVVVVGADDAEHVVLLNDPAQRKLLKEDRARFEKDWKATGNWTLLAVPAAGAQR